MVYKKKNSPYRMLVMTQNDSSFGDKYLKIRALVRVLDVTMPEGELTYPGKWDLPDSVRDCGWDQFQITGQRDCGYQGDKDFYAMKVSYDVYGDITEEKAVSMAKYLRAVNDHELRLRRKFGDPSCMGTYLAYIADFFTDMPHPFAIREEGGYQFMTPPQLISWISSEVSRWEQQCRS